MAWQDTPRTQYERDGFFLAPTTGIASDCVSRAVRGMDNIRMGEYETGIPPLGSPWNPGDDPARLCKIEMPQVCDRGVWDLVSHPELGRLVADVTGAMMVQVWWVQLLYKPPVRPEDPTPTTVGWHQDRQYWGAWEDDSELLTAWVALSDVGEDCGPMRFVRGSHTWGLVDGGDFYVQDPDRQEQEMKRPEGAAWEEATALLPAGGVSLHHHLTLHASAPNTSALPRRSFAIHLRTERSRPRDGQLIGLTRFINDVSRCPVVYGSL